MTNKTSEEIAKNISLKIVQQWCSTPRKDRGDLKLLNVIIEEEIKYQLRNFESDIRKDYRKGIEALREQAAQTMPSREEVFAWHEQYYERYNTLPLPIEVYDWLRDNTKPKERHDEKELEEAAREYAANFIAQDGFIAGYRAALEKIKV